MNRSISLLWFHLSGGARVAARNAIATIGLIIIVLGSAPDPWVWLRFLSLGVAAKGVGSGPLIGLTLIALAAIVRGETTHHEVLGHAVASALASLSVETGLPIGFGVLTCDTMEQARRRSEKGVEAAEAAIEMANLRRHLKNGKR